MTELDAALIRRKLSAMRRNLMDLEQVAGLTLAEYRRDRFRLKGAERMLQEIIEAAVDVNQHILSARTEAVASDSSLRSRSTWRTAVSEIGARGQS